MLSLLLGCMSLSVSYPGFSADALDVENLLRRTASRCLACSKPIAQMNGYGGQMPQCVDSI